MSENKNQMSSYKIFNLWTDFTYSNRYTKTKKKQKHVYKNKNQASNYKILNLWTDFTYCNRSIKHLHAERASQLLIEYIKDVILLFLFLAVQWGRTSGGATQQLLTFLCLLLFSQRFVILDLPNRRDEITGILRSSGGEGGSGRRMNHGAVRALPLQRIRKRLRGGDETRGVPGGDTCFAREGLFTWWLVFADHANAGSVAREFHFVKSDGGVPDWFFLFSVSFLTWILIGSWCLRGREESGWWVFIKRSKGGVQGRGTELSVLDFGFANFGILFWILYLPSLLFFFPAPRYTFHVCSSVADACICTYVWKLWWSKFNEIYNHHF